MGQLEIKLALSAYFQILEDESKTPEQRNEIVVNLIKEALDKK